MVKKYITAGLFSLLSGAAFAQNDAMAPTPDQPHSFKSKRGYEVLPQCGDWGLGLSATGFLSYIGNMMNNNSLNVTPGISNANGPSTFALGSIGGPAITAKYMKSATMAYRVRFQANAGQTAYRNLVAKSLLTPDPLNPQFVEDKLAINNHVVLLGFGIEKRRGQGRLQGVYGAELLAGFSGSKSTYTYGNAFSVDFNAPLSTSDFLTGGYLSQASRRSEVSTGTNWLAGVRGFLGAEYFFAPKISLGGELGYSLGMSSGSKGYVTVEYWNAAESKKATVTTDTYTNSGLRSWGLGVDNVNAGINLHLYF